MSVTHAMPDDFKVGSPCPKCGKPIELGDRVSRSDVTCVAPDLGVAGALDRLAKALEGAGTRLAEILEKPTRHVDPIQLPPLKASIPDVGSVIPNVGSVIPLDEGLHAIKRNLARDADDEIAEAAGRAASDVLDAVPYENDLTETDIYRQMGQAALKAARETADRLAGTVQPVKKEGQPEAEWWQHPDGTPRRLKACADRWPQAETSDYNPSCCRFPKSCSATIYDPELVSEEHLEPRRES